MTTTMRTEHPNRTRGFASMDLSKQREIASKGGKAAHAQGRAPGGTRAVTQTPAE